MKDRGEIVKVCHEDEWGEYGLLNECSYGRNRDGRGERRWWIIILPEEKMPDSTWWERWWEGIFWVHPPEEGFRTKKGAMQELRRLVRRATAGAG